MTLATVLAAGSLGSTVALAREKTFQALAMTALILVMWIGLSEAARALLGTVWLGGWRVEPIAEACSPLRAILAAAHPVPGRFGTDAAYIGVCLVLAALLNGLASDILAAAARDQDVRPAQVALREIAGVIGFWAAAEGI